MNKQKITLDLQKLIVVIIYFSTIFFNGGVFHSVEIGGLNSYFDLIFILIYCTLPIISSYVLLNYFNEQTFSFSVHPRSILIGVIVFLFILTKNFNNQNLFSDEYYYSFGCFKVVLGLINYFEINEIGLLGNISYGFFLRFSISFLFLASFYLLKFLFSSEKNIRKNKTYYFLLFIIKLILILINTSSDVHPPLNYFPTSIFIMIFGMNIISIKASIIFVNVLLIIYLYNRLKLSESSIIYISILIFSVPVIENFSIYLDQSIYSMICFSLVILEITYKKIKPKNLMLIISIFSLFRYSSIASYPVAFIYCYLYYNRLNIDWKNKAKKIIGSMTPIVLSIPILIFPILMGTPTTDKIHQIDYSFYSLLQFKGSLTERIFHSFGELLIIPLICFVFLIFSKKIKILLYLFLTYFSYHFLFISSNAPINAPKYLLEQIGFIYVYSITFLVNKLDNFKMVTKYLKFSFLVILMCIFFNHNFYRYKNFTSQSNYHDTYGYYFRNNSQDYLVDYIDSNNLYNESLLIGVDYGPMFLGLYNTTISEYKNYTKNWVQYVLKKKNSGTGWLDLDIDAIREMENIKFLFISDYIFDYNEAHIRRLINIDGWKVVSGIEKTNNFSDFRILKRSL